MLKRTMSRHYSQTEAPHRNRSDSKNFRALVPYLWEFRGRVLLALACLVLAKVANVGIPLILKQVVDELDSDLGVPIVLLLAYGLLRVASGLFNEMRDALFARVRYRAMRRLTTRTLAHLHQLSLRFHLERKTGAISRDLQRGAASLSTLLNYMTFSILPVIVEFALVAGIMFTQYDPVFTIVIFISVAAYVVFTLAITNWRMEHRLQMNRFESEANNQAIDSLINFESVKYFGNEALETKRCDDTLESWENSAVLSQTSMSALNFGQGAIIAVGVTIIMFFASVRVSEGSMTLGDLVLVNAFLLQLFIPLGFLGIVYRQIKYSFADMDNLVRLLETPPEISNAENARELKATRGEVVFDRVSFAYNAERPILHDVSFTIAPGNKLAVVGASGAGKSTLARLLFRFYDVSGGRVTVDGQDIRDVTQESLRAAIGIVPQDTALFNDTVHFNIQYARPGASEADVIEAAKVAHIHEFISSLPEGYQTVVGERGLKLSGGEKQRVAIARAVLKAPKIMVFDEATSALDSKSEQAILQALRDAAADHTTLVIAHRLSTIVDADTILVMEAGRIVESGSHHVLLENGGVYASLWALQQREREKLEGSS